MAWLPPELMPPIISSKLKDNKVDLPMLNIFSLYFEPWHLYFKKHLEQILAAYVSIFWLTFSVYCYALARLNEIYYVSNGGLAYPDTSISALNLSAFYPVRKPTTMANTKREPWCIDPSGIAKCWVMSAVRQDFGVQFDKLTVRAVPEPAEGQSNAHCELSAEYSPQSLKGFEALIPS
jgi:hypothetical protein